VIRALLVYPDIPSRDELLRWLTQEPELSVVGDCVYVDDAMDKIEFQRPDVVFVGTEVADFTGLRSLSWAGLSKPPQVVVISDCERYALEAFAINAIDYLLTPIEQVRFKAAVHRVRRSVEAEQRLDRRLDLDTLVDYLRGYVGKPQQPDRQDDRVPINFGGRFRFLNMKNIRYIQADADYVDIHMVTGEVLHSTSRISEMSTKLPADRFLRIRRSTIVNVEHVREARAHKENYEIVMDDDATFRPGTTYKSKVRAALVKGLAAGDGGRASMLEPSN